MGATAAAERRSLVGGSPPRRVEEREGSLPGALAQQSPHARVQAAARAPVVDRSPLRPGPPAAAALANRHDRKRRRRSSQPERPLSPAPNSRSYCPAIRRCAGWRATAQSSDPSIGARSDVFNLDPGRSGALEIENVGDPRGDVHHPPAVIGPAIVDAHDRSNSRCRGWSRARSSAAAWSDGRR